ncbi:glutamate racemase [Brochothrix campestris FSL F6-1037]|uniref:Glutamate racemase n=1 Tax=Brochothrix campestris FSL F6-1037 TaxID=1265861 RepID=W7CUR1_9LIST|nr:glutamate racemase [Brochothrix campestris FSL F6-1037]
MVAQSLRPFKNSGIDTFVLGCTHYPLLQPIIENVLGPRVKVINPGLETASEVSMLLDYFTLRNVSDEPQQHRFFYDGFSQNIWRHRFRLVRLTTNGRRVCKNRSRKEII